jgi:hypothetical protein
MRDETINELLSRYLDGDLDAHEVEIVEERLRTDTDLRHELEAMRQIQDSVSALASADTVPPELDAVIDPLLRGQPEPIVARPWARWLAAAAVIVIGATAVIEVSRRNPGPDIESFARATEERRQAEPADRFALAPLPTSSVPPEDQPLGASDRLLASPIPEVELDDPPPLEVLGPLEEEERQASIVESDVMEDAAFANEGIATAPRAAAEKSRAKAVVQPKAEAGLERRRSDQNTGQAGGRSEALQAWDAGPPVGRGQLFVFVDGRSAWREFTPSAGCKPGRYSVRIVIAEGRVHEARPVGGAASASPSQRLCAAELVLDLEIDGVDNGEYPAEVVVESRGSSN